VNEWNKNMTQDSELRGVLGIVEQLQFSNDVSKDLEHLLAIQSSYM